ncbi:MAG: hypothetical protein ACXW2X_07010 [Thermoanaerobaculia bacterium]
MPMRIAAEKGAETMAKSKKNAKNPGKPSVKVEDLKAKKNPKGGASDIFAKIGDIKGESLVDKHRSVTTAPVPNPALKLFHK